MDKTKKSWFKWQPMKQIQIIREKFRRPESLVNDQATACFFIFRNGQALTIHVKADRSRRRNEQI
ncbi:hypothetical protein EEL32_04950 [Brevibacillus laterosporus]|nr:hypothetical protein EEL31_04175 [Brevibacillus laterosporus]TPG89465.1 hypothetical protein EEL32_04950 [Brevibacillus laterosporus]